MYNISHLLVIGHKIKIIQESSSLDKVWVSFLVIVISFK